MESPETSKSFHEWLKSHYAAPQGEKPTALKHPLALTDHEKKLLESHPLKSRVRIMLNTAIFKANLISGRACG